MDLKKLFQRDSGDGSGPVTEFDSSVESGHSIRDGYRALILEQLERGGVSSACVEVDVRQGGLGPDGRPLFQGMLRLTTWDRRSAVRLLLGLPILESRVRKLARGSWMHDLASFSGLWLHVSGQLQGTQAMEDLRALLVDVERKESAGAASAPAVWSVPPETGMGQL